MDDKTIDKLKIGNVCAARPAPYLFEPSAAPPNLPHEPLINPETTKPVERLNQDLMLTEHVCKHCGSIYAVQDG